MKSSNNKVANLTLLADEIELSHRPPLKMKWKRPDESTLKIPLTYPKGKDLLIVLSFARSNMDKTGDVFKFYKETFNSDVYVKITVGGDDYNGKWVMEDEYHRLFNKGKLTGKTLLDVGCGPLFRPALSGSAFVQEIHLCDFVPENLKAIEKWLSQCPDAPDYSNQFKHVAQLEEKKEYTYLEDRTRRAIKAVFHCDILADINPLNPRPHQQYDIVTSTGVLDSFPDEKDYSKAMKNLASLIKPGGVLFFCGALEGYTWSMEGAEGGTFALPFVNPQRLKRVFSEVNLKVDEIREHKFKEHKYAKFQSEGKGFVSATAVKLK